MTMSDNVKMFINMIFASLIASAMRLARVAAVRAELESYTALFEEARALEEGGQARLAQHVRREIDGILSGSSFPAADPGPHGDHGPFALESSTGAEPLALERGALNEAEGQGSAPPRRRRGRPRASKESDTSLTATRNGEAKAEAEASAEFPERANLMSENEATAEQTKLEGPHDMNEPF